VAFAGGATLLLKHLPQGSRFMRMTAFAQRRRRHPQIAFLAHFASKLNQYGGASVATANDMRGGLAQRSESA